MNRSFFPMARNNFSLLSEIFTPSDSVSSPQPATKTTIIDKQRACSKVRMPHFLQVPIQSIVYSIKCL